MRNILYFIVAIASLCVLTGMAYAGLAEANILPSVQFLQPLSALYVGFYSFETFIIAIPVLIMALICLTNFWSKSIKILFLVIFFLVAIVIAVLIIAPDFVLSLAPSA